VTGVSWNLGNQELISLPSGECRGLGVDTAGCGGYSVGNTVGNTLVIREGWGDGETAY
jgi:hypothetical protein